jgi:hypothetical protein
MCAARWRSESVRVCARVAWWRASLARCVNFLCTGRLCALSARIMQKNRHRDSENRRSCVRVCVCVCARACAAVCRICLEMSARNLLTRLVFVCVCVWRVWQRGSHPVSVNRVVTLVAALVRAIPWCMLALAHALNCALSFVHHHHHHHHTTIAYLPHLPPPSPPHAPPSLTDHHHRKPQVVLWDFNEAKCAETVDELNATSA